MGLYNFRPQFVPKIESGEKTHTIRAPRRYQDVPGKPMHLYTGLRQKGARRLMVRPCVKVQSITISLIGNVTVDGALLDGAERELLAASDGFESYEAMFQFWRGRLPFRGCIFHWEKL